MIETSSGGLPAPFGHGTGRDKPCPYLLTNAARRGEVVGAGLSLPARVWRR